MKIVVYPHDLGIGGSQINAIEIAGAVRDLGHEVIVFGRPGPLEKHIHRLGLEFVESPQPHRRPSLNVSVALARLIRNRGIDVVHGYEWPPALECLAATRLAPHAAAVATVMSMSVAPFLPKYLPLAVGTQEIVDAERNFGRDRVTLIEPPVDLKANRVDGDFETEHFRSTWGLRADRSLVVLVSRLANELKLEGILSAITAVESLAATTRVSLLIVGDGPARAQVEAQARKVNLSRGEGTIIVTGPLDDPRPAYSLADVTLGMGGSALRSLAFGKPLIVQGENGFWELLTPSSLPQFLWRGWYGVGQDPERGAETLATILAELLADDEVRYQLGQFGLETVRERFSTEQAGQRQMEIYESALVEQRRGFTGDDLRAAARLLRYKASRRIDQIRGRLKSDDFNSEPVATHAGLLGDSTGTGVLS